MMHTALLPSAVPGGLLASVVEGIFDSHTPAGASTRLGRLREQDTLWLPSSAQVPRATRLRPSSCRAPPSTMARGRRSSGSQLSRTTPCPGCTRSIASTCATRTRKNPLCESCTMALTTTSWTFSTATACSHPPTRRPRRCAQLLEARVSARRSATTTAGTARSATTGTSATCSGSASTWPTFPKSPIATAPCLSNCLQDDVDSEW
mmetsp:Transcript_8339/g.12147  ORF Transcript_8339/g.12147 Transcript_8339/m.12147 type:complete len:206 (-) Transcript_8339:44-661(-)